jgi:hypothetical protein
MLPLILQSFNAGPTKNWCHLLYSSTCSFELYCNSNAESNDDKVSVDYLASTEMDEHMSSLSERLIA